MNTRGLSLDQAPPVGVPFSFFLVAPAFALAGAAVLWAGGAGALQSRWMPATLAATHAVTLGFMALVMVGALLQMLPVVAGAPVARPALVAWLVHPPLVAGAALLVAGFAAMNPALLTAAAVALGAGFLAFVVAAARSLWSVPAANVTVTGMRLAVVSLVVTVSLGLVFLGAWGWRARAFPMAIRELHPLWGLGGWTALLVAGIAWQVVPMFHLTPPFPRAARAFLPAAFAVLVLRSVALAGVPRVLASGLVAAAAFVFSGLALRLLSRRRRRTADPLHDFWRVALVSLPLAAAAWASDRVPGFAVGVLAIVGFAVSAITGMLYRIVPFLAWFHLHAAAGGRTRVPIMSDFVPKSAPRRQLRLHVGGVAGLVGATFAPVLFLPALALFVAAMATLWFDLLRAAFTFRRVSRELVNARG